MNISFSAIHDINETSDHCRTNTFSPKRNTYGCCGNFIPTSRNHIRENRTTFVKDDDSENNERQDHVSPERTDMNMNISS